MTRKVTNLLIKAVYELVDFLERDGQSVEVKFGIAGRICAEVVTERCVIWLGENGEYYDLSVDLQMKKGVGGGVGLWSLVQVGEDSIWNTIKK
jgi:hypothetical protein